jgi:WhiB family transcriptional regulator, redox-sensing transcriptional regulator
MAAPRTPTSASMRIAGPRSSRAPGHWVLEAACKGQGHLFVMPEGTVEPSRSRTRQLDRARALCRVCDVRDDCRSWAMSSPDPAAGLIAGGLTPDDRRRQRASERRLRAG